jgi:hypothetical protein
MDKSMRSPGASPKERGGIVMLKPHWTHLLLPLSLLVPLSAVVAQPQSPYLLQSWVIANGGSHTTSAEFAIYGSLGQPTPVGTSVAPGIVMRAGYWEQQQPPSAIPEDQLPGSYRYALYQNRPNPFSPATTIKYTLAEEGPVELAVFDLSGRRIVALVRGVQQAGEYRITWDGINDRGVPVASGIYFCRLKTDSFEDSKRMLMLK